MDVLQRLVHARALDRLGHREPARPAGERTPQVSAPFERRELPIPLCPAPAGARSFADRGARPSSLGGCLARVALPDRAALARDLVCAGAGRGDRAVFIDTETTGLAGAAVPFVIGLAWHASGALKLAQWTLTRLGGEAELLADVLRVLAQLDPDPLVSFNGASFDLPLLRARVRHHGLSERLLLDVEHLDLLHPARRLHGGRGRDCRLATLERDLVGLQRRGDIDSAQIPAVYWAWLRSPDDPVAQQRLRAVRDHNLVDVVSMPALASALARLVREPDDLDRARRAARHLQKLGAEAQARSLLADWIEPGRERGAWRSPQWREAALELATLERRAGARDRAARLWHAAWQGDPGCPVAAEAWAKHLEHHAGDVAEALRVARGSRLPCERRITRLEHRVTRAAPGDAPAEARDTATPVPAPAPEPVAPSPAPHAPLLRAVEDESGVRLRYRLLR